MTFLFLTLAIKLKKSVNYYNGYIGAIAKGAYEFGQRALGNESIIGLPSTKGVVHKINTAIKMRTFGCLLHLPY